MREFNENEVILDKDEYHYLKDMADRYDPFWFCTFGGCEGACKECKDTCEMSIFVKERKATAEKILKDIMLLIPNEIEIITRYFKQILGVEIKE